MGFVGWCRHFLEEDVENARKLAEEVGGTIIPAVTSYGKQRGLLVLSQKERPGWRWRPIVVSGKDVVVVQKNGQVVRAAYDCFGHSAHGIRLIPDRAEVQFVEVSRKGILVRARWSIGCAPPRFRRFSDAERELRAGMVR